MRLVNADHAPVYLNEAACKQIKNMPTVDAVEVVRCRNCKFFRAMKYSGSTYCKRTVETYGIRITNPEDFCSYGERKEERMNEK